MQGERGVARLSDGLSRLGESNQYWSHDEPVLVTIVKQYWSLAQPVLLASLTSTGCFLPLRWGLLLSALQGTIFLPASGPSPVRHPLLPDLHELSSTLS